MAAVFRLKNYIVLIK